MNTLKGKKVIYTKIKIEPFKGLDAKNKTDEILEADFIILNQRVTLEEAKEHYEECYGEVKPPVGLRPNFIWIEQRIIEIEEAITRYREVDRGRHGWNAKETKGCIYKRYT